MTDRTIKLTEELIKRKSVTPKDEGCQQLMTDILAPLGFHCEQMNFDDTENLWALKGDQEPVFIFAGHTDVVPPGNLEKWQSDPFEPAIKDGHLFGRGAADMKASLAAMLTATEQFIKKYPAHKGSIGFLITSDEEGPFINGTVRVVEELMKRNQAITYALVGEPSSTSQLGDIVKKGRRGSLTGWLTVHGHQGHVAYPHLAENAIHIALTSLTELSQTQWDEGNDSFPPTSFQITNIHGGTGVGNVIPGDLQVEFNFRYSTEQTAEDLKHHVRSVLNDHKLNVDLEWKLNGEPFITEEGVLLAATRKAIRSHTSIETSAETTGGTSDGRFIAKTGAQVIELGPINKTIHQVNECVKVDDVILLSKIYEDILVNTLINDDDH